MPDTTISNLPAAASAQSAAVVAADNAAGDTTQKVTLGQIATLAAGSAPVQSVNGQTGTVALTKTDVSLGNVDNTSDANKPVSTAQAAADSAVQAAAVQRANHTGTQLASTISDFNTAASGAAPVQSVAGKTGVVLLAGGDITSGTVAVARLPTVLEQLVAVGNSGTATTLSLSSGSFQTVTLNANCTFTMPSAAAGASLTLIVSQGGSFTATFTGVIWPNAAAPVITPTTNKRDILVFISDGVSWFGSFTQNF